MRFLLFSLLLLPHLLLAKCDLKESLEEFLFRDAQAQLEVISKKSLSDFFSEVPQKLKEAVDAIVEKSPSGNYLEDFKVTSSKRDDLGRPFWKISFGDEEYFVKTYARYDSPELALNEVRMASFLETQGLGPESWSIQLNGKVYFVSKYYQSVNLREFDGFKNRPQQMPHIPRKLKDLAEAIRGMPPSSLHQAQQVMVDHLMANGTLPKFIKRARALLERLEIYPDDLQIMVTNHPERPLMLVDVEEFKSYADAIADYQLPGEVFDPAHQATLKFDQVLKEVYLLFIQ